MTELREKGPPSAYGFRAEAAHATICSHGILWPLWLSYLFKLSFGAITIILKCPVLSEMAPKNFFIACLKGGVFFPSCCNKGYKLDDFQ